MEYTDFYSYLKEGDVSALQNPAKIQYTDDIDCTNFTNDITPNKDVPNFNPSINRNAVLDKDKVVDLGKFLGGSSEVKSDNPAISVPDIVNQKLDIDVTEPEL